MKITICIDCKKSFESKYASAVVCPECVPKHQARARKELQIRAEEGYNSGKKVADVVRRK